MHVFGKIISVTGLVFFMLTAMIFIAFGILLEIDTAVFHSLNGAIRSIFGSGISRIIFTGITFYPAFFACLNILAAIYKITKNRQDREVVLYESTALLAFSGVLFSYYWFFYNPTTDCSRDACWRVVGPIEFYSFCLSCGLIVFLVFLERKS